MRTNKKINELLHRHESLLERVVLEAEIPAPRLREAIHYTLFPGGKRLRPILVYLCGELLNLSPEILDYIAAAIELTHCYSLVHDDLPSMDDDDLRRGKPSCHRAFDEATAILVGDGMQSLAIDVLLSGLKKLVPAEKIIAIVQELVHASGPAGMVSGQSLDLSELCNPDINEEQLNRIHQLKTGKLIRACITMTLAAGKPNDSQKHNLNLYAQHLGLVFQMQDDYLDAYASTSLLGKGRASDQSNGKRTFANLYPKDDLYDLINQYFNFAKTALLDVAAEDNTLWDLTTSLEQRHHHC